MILDVAQNLCFRQKLLTKASFMHSKLWNIQVTAPLFLLIKIYILIHFPSLSQSNRVFLVTDVNDDGFPAMAEPIAPLQEDPGLLNCVCIIIWKL